MYSEEPESYVHTQTGRKILFVLWSILFFAGLALYIIWAALWNAWFDVGLYSVTISMMALGLVEMYINFPAKNTQLQA